MKRIVAAVQSDGVRGAGKAREMLLEVPEMAAIDQLAVRHDVAVRSVNLRLNSLIRLPRIYEGNDIGHISCRSVGRCNLDRRPPRHLARATPNKTFQSDFPAKGSAIG